MVSDSVSRETMNRSELLKLHGELCTEAKLLMERKNHDYAGGENGVNPFANFTRCEDMGFTTTSRGFGVRLTDKVSRLSTFCETGILKVSDEGLKDTVQDIINYVILFLADTAQEKGNDIDAFDAKCYEKACMICRDQEIGDLNERFGRSRNESTSSLE